MGAAVLVLLTGCARPVEVSPAAASADPACARVPWPQVVAGQEASETTPDSPTTAAWSSGGDPAIIARCGVPVPGPTTKECLGVDGVDWVVRHLEDGMAFTTYGRDPAVEVLVPGRYAPEPLVLSAFGGLATHGRATGHRCS